jgi:hypothetical protein
MGAFNVVETIQRCPACKREAKFLVQFKFGELWQYHYEIGDLIQWGERYRRQNEGRPGLGRVAVDGAAEPCPFCGADGGDYEVIIESDHISEVHPLAEPQKFSKQTFIIENP